MIEAAQRLFFSITIWYRRVAVPIQFLKSCGKGGKMTRKPNCRLVIVLVAGLLLPCISAQASDPNLIAHWTFDEGTGTTAYDSVAGNHGIVNDANWTDGQVNAALGFDGINDYVDVSPATDLDFERTDAFTLSAWYKGGAGANTILSKMNAAASYRGYDMFIINGYASAHLVSNWSSNAIREDGTLYPVDDGTWHHIVMTYDGSSSADGLKIYVDAMEETTSIYRDSLSSTIQNSVSFKVAARSNGSGTTQHVNGAIDDVRIYNIALSAEEVEELYWQAIEASQRAIMATEEALDEKLDALERIDAALEREWAAHDALEELLASGDYGDLNKRDIAAAQRQIESAIRRQGRLRKLLLESIESLEDSLSLLGYTPDPNAVDNEL